MDSIASSTHEDSPTGSTTTATGLLELVDWTKLPAETRATIRTIGPLMQEGCSQKEIGRRLKLSDATVATMVGEIRGAILAQAYELLDDLEPKMRGLVERLRAAEPKAA